MCECLNWARTDFKFFTDHHPNCDKYVPEVFEKSKTYLQTILKHFRNYCNEGDGIPREAWDDYKRAILFIGDIDRFSKCLEEETIER